MDRANNNISDIEFEKKLQQHYDDKRQPVTRSLDKICELVREMVSDSKVQQLVDRFGFCITNVSWEDNSRDKSSIYGPCVSDMTLLVGQFQMPLIRSPNFTDLSWDVKMEKIPLVVGNENGVNLHVITLTEYLQNFSNYLHNSSGFKFPHKSLHASRDTHVLMSAQACFLPVPFGSEVEFNVALFNFQSSVGNPAVLAIVATAKGTSAHIIDSANGRSGQKLFFNKNGKKKPFCCTKT